LLLKGTGNEAVAAHTTAANDDAGDDDVVEEEASSVGLRRRNIAIIGQEDKTRPSVSQEDTRRLHVVKEGTDTEDLDLLPHVYDASIVATDGVKGE
jgi:hypothetical protein